MPKVSVIITSFNSEQYIKKCIDSLLCQTLKDIEIIVINDGSKDNTKMILNGYNDKRLLIFNNKNHGVGYSRNYGLKKANAPYICFIDSDDYVEKNYCETLYKKINEDEADIVVSNYYEMHDGILKKCIIPKFSNTNLKENPKILCTINLSPWNKIYRRKFLEENKIFFPEDLKYEDVLFIIKCLNKASKIGYVEELLNYYVIHSNSETTIMNERVFDILIVLKKVFSEVDGILSGEELICREISIYNIRQRYQKDKRIRRKFIKESFDFLKEYIPNYKNNCYYRKRNLCKMIIEKSKFLSILYCDLYNIFK